jgi:hypothetical protein
MRGLAAQPILRNLKITQSYHGISSAFTAVAGGQNVNWCTFAVWASKTAGRFIRLQDTRLLVDALEQSERYSHAIAAINQRLGARLPETTLVDLIGEIVGVASGQIAQGNFLVWDELAPLFTDLSNGAPVWEQLRPGDTTQAGQDLLRSAMMTYHQVRSEPDPHRKAERLLLANAQVGLHEQIRLQPCIAGALDAPMTRPSRRFSASGTRSRSPRAWRAACSRPWWT